MTNERSVTRHPSLLLSLPDFLAADTGQSTAVSRSASGAVGSDVATGRAGESMAVYRSVPGALGSVAVRPRSPHQRRPRPDTIRRRRIAVLFGVGLLTLTGVGVASAAGSHSGDAKTEVHVVLPGESFWSIAREAQPKGDIRRLVNKLAEQMQGEQLQPGDELIVPVAGSR